MLVALSTYWSQLPQKHILYVSNKLYKSTFISLATLWKMSIHSELRNQFEISQKHKKFRFLKIEMCEAATYFDLWLNFCESLLWLPIWLWFVFYFHKTKTNGKWQQQQKQHPISLWYDKPSQMYHRQPKRNLVK